MICSGSQTGSMGTLISALMMMAFRLSRVRAFARMQENMLLPLPGLPETVMTSPIGNSFPKGGMPLTFFKTNVSYEVDYHQFNYDKGVINEKFIDRQRKLVSIERADQK